VLDIRGRVWHTILVNIDNSIHHGLRDIDDLGDIVPLIVCQLSASLLRQFRAFRTYSEGDRWQCPRSRRLHLR
jgi:hypothetical protein